MEELKEKLMSEFGIPENRLPNSVLHKCIEDTAFLSDVLMCWKDDFMYSLVLKQIPSTNTISDTELLKTSSKSVIKWIKGGMKFSSETIYNERLLACNSCEHSSLPSSSLLYKISRSVKICKLCGCDIHKKAKLLTETCPDTSYGKYNRWKK